MTREEKLTAIREKLIALAAYVPNLDPDRIMADQPSISDAALDEALRTFASSEQNLAKSRIPGNLVAVPVKKE